MDPPRDATGALPLPGLQGPDTIPSATLDPSEAEALRALIGTIRFRDDSPFRPHLGFLLWIIGALRPRRFVQVGLGDLLPCFAACQAVEGQGGPACGLGIAPPGTAIAPRVLAHAEAFHPGLALLTGDPLALAAEQAPGSVDLLLLSPGARNLEALLSAWTPALSPRAVVLVHGTGAGLPGSEPAARLAAAKPVVLRPEGLGLALILAGSEPEPRLTALVRNGEAVLGDLAALSEEALSESRVTDPMTARLLDQLDAKEAALRDLETSLAARYREIAALEGLLAGGFRARWRAQRPVVARPPRAPLRTRAVQAGREILDRSPPAVAGPLRRAARLARRLLRR